MSHPKNNKQINVIKKIITPDPNILQTQSGRETNEAILLPSGGQILKAPVLSSNTPSWQVPQALGLL